MSRMDRKSRAPRAFVAALIVVLAGIAAPASFAETAAPSHWKAAWPKTDFSKHSVPLKEIRDVIRKDGIPAIDNPKFATAEEAAKLGLTDKEPVVSIVVKGDARAYPLRILTWHEIVNDTVGGTPVSVTFCPLCNSAIVFDRRVDGTVYDFGTTGKLRKSDLVMYDRQTQSWWQQFLGKGLVGAMSGKRLIMLPMRMESFERFRKRHPDGKVLVPNKPRMRRYGLNPYRNYDSSSRPFLYPDALPKGIPPLERVVVIGKEAWAFSLLRKKKRVEAGDLIITWETGQNSALDAGLIKDGKDVGNVVVQRRGKDGKLVDAVHDVSFAFAFHAFYPKGKIHVGGE